MRPRAVLSLMMLGVLVTSVAWAQCLDSSNKKWNLDDPALELFWEFSVIVDPPPTGFRVKIGTAPRTYTVSRDVPATQFSLSISTMIPGPGSYYAAVAPLYGTQEGGIGPECPFVLSRPELMLGVRKKP